MNKDNKIPFNGMIGGTQVRIIHNGDSQMYPKHVALQKAKELGLDLIQIAKDPNGIAVCKVADFGKYKYELSKKKTKVQVKEDKEIRLRPCTDVNDFNIKIKRATDFLEDGHTVIFKLKLKGREKAHRDIAFDMLNRVKNEMPAFRFDAIKSSDAGMIMRAQL